MNVCKQSSNAYSFSQRRKLAIFRGQKLSVSMIQPSFFKSHTWCINLLSWTNYLHSFMIQISVARVSDLFLFNPTALSLPASLKKSSKENGLALTFFPLNLSNIYFKVTFINKLLIIKQSLFEWCVNSVYFIGYLTYKSSTH